MERFSPCFLLGAIGTAPARPHLNPLPGSAEGERVVFLGLAVLDGWLLGSSPSPATTVWC